VLTAIAEAAALDLADERGNDTGNDAELAARLYISPKTADHHVSAILAKLQVKNRREAAQAGRQLGILVLMRCYLTRGNRSLGVTRG